MPESISLPFNPSPRLHDYTGLWFIQPEAASALIRVSKGMDWAEHAKTFIGSQDPRDQGHNGSRLAYILHDNGVAEVQLSGTLMKHESSMEASTSTVFARRALRQAADDDRVIAIVLRVDSPGGTVSGTDDLGADVAAANARKPVVAFAEDLMASAAYWIGTQAEAIFANSKTAKIGSIGTYMGMYDLSEHARQEGVEALVFATGELKGMGFPGTKVTDQQRDYLQRMVDQSQALFNETVQRGRGLSAEAVAKVATGAVWQADEAQALGLIDGIKTFDEVVAHAAGLAFLSTPPKQRSSTMSATAKDIKQACTGADADFVMSQLEAESSVEDAKTAYIDTLAARIQNRDERIKTLETEHKAKVDELATQHAESLKAKDDEVSQLKSDLANVQLGATDNQTTPASGSGDTKKPRTLADMVSLN